MITIKVQDSDSVIQITCFFVPCYSEQNGCYTTDIKIYYTNTKEVLNLMCEERIYQHKGDRYKVKKYQEALDWGEENE